jgi:hypothetical protein
MHLATVSQPAYLMRRQTFSLHTRKGQRIECRTGQIWVTQDGDARDVILGSDESLTLDRSGHTLVSALEDASFMLRVDAAPARAHTPAESAAY